MKQNKGSFEGVEEKSKKEEEKFTELKETLESRREKVEKEEKSTELNKMLETGKEKIEKEKSMGLKETLESGKEYYEIRLESIGGLGANLCGKMLGELGVKYLNLNSSSFSSYGSEKTGTPVKGFIRYCNDEKEIRVHSPVIEPDLLVVFHQALLNDSSVLKGCGKNTSIIIALETGQEQPEILKKVKSISCYENDKNRETGRYYGLEAQRIAMETHSRMNVVMFGAALKIMGMKNLEAGEKICKDTLGKKYPDALKANLEGIRRGYEEVKLLEFGEGKEKSGSSPKECRQEKEHAIKEELQGNKLGTDKNQDVFKDKRKECVDKKAKDKKEYPEWGYKNAPIGGINTRAGSTVVSDVSPSRQGYIPVFIKERCINCGLCHSTCPDMVFQFSKGEYKGREMMINQGLDYYHCKGCLRCVDVCPVNALVQGAESEHLKKEYFMMNQELLRKPEYYEEAGPDGYITSESYLTEKRMEGGEV